MTLRSPTDPSRVLPGEIVKHLVRRIPRGRVASYGVVARAAAAQGRPIGGGRTVAWILASLGGERDIPWYRVVGRGGIVRLPDERGEDQTNRLKREGVRFLKGVIGPDFLIDEHALLSAGDPPSGRRRPG